MRKEGTLGKREAQLLAQRIKAFTKEDRKHQARRAGKTAMSALKGGNPNEAWRIVQA